MVHIFGEPCCLLFRLPQRQYILFRCWYVSTKFPVLRPRRP